MGSETNKTIISENNFRTCYFAQGDLKAFVSMGAEPHAEIPGEIIDLFFATLARDQHGDIEQECFEELQLALNWVNSRFGHWDFTDMAKKVATKSGCSSCVAH